MRKKNQINRRYQSKRRGGKPEGLPISGIANKFWIIKYEVLCDENISASTLFDIGKVTLSNMNEKEVVVDAYNLVISHLYNREQDAYLVQFNVTFEEKQSADWVHQWKKSYLEGIRKENTMCNPVEKTFFAEPTEEIEYPPYVVASDESMDV